MDDDLGSDPSSDNGPQRTFSAVGYDFRVDPSVTLKDAKDDRLARGTASSFASLSPRAEVALVDLDLASLDEGIAFTGFGQAAPDLEVDGIGRAQAEAGEGSRFRGGEVERKTAHEVSEFRLADFRTEIVSINTRHIRKLATQIRCFAS